MSLLKIPQTEAELLERAALLAGTSFGQLALELNLVLPTNPNYRKGWIGQALELALGADAKNKAEPDFQALNIELKTLPLAQTGKPAESTFITSIPLLTLGKQLWPTSTCYSKLKRILWIPVEGDRNIPYTQRRIGKGFLWSPSAEQESILEADWTYLRDLLSTGQLEQIDASLGTYLQVRPKAAHGHSLCYGYNSEGAKVLTLPRGFYLRACFTEQIINKEKV